MNVDIEELRAKMLLEIMPNLVLMACIQELINDIDGLPKTREEIRVVPSTPREMAAYANDVADAVAAEYATRRNARSGGPW